MSFRSTYSNPLKPSQQEGLKWLMDWVNDPKVPVATLAGFAGTGKTFLLKYFIANYKKSVCITAPTHKALKQVSKATGLTGKTIQSLHGLRPNYNGDFNFRNLQFDTIGVPHLNAYSLIIIDEASMVTAGLKALNELRAKQYGVKILYVGDDAQLPPIKESMSTVFTIPGFKLTEIIRQSKESPLLDVLSTARSDVYSGRDALQHLLAKKTVAFNNENEGYIVLDKRNFTNTVIQYFQSDNFSKNVDFLRYTAYTNDNILAWNNVIRNSLLDNPQALITEDDLLTGYNSIVDENLSPVLINSCDYIIRDITPRITDDGFNVFSTILVDDTNKSEMINIVDHRSTTYGKFVSKVIRLHNIAALAPVHLKAKRWTEFYNFKNHYLSMIPIHIPDAKYPVPKDIDYGYGLTIHKLQGSTLDNVFINIPDMMSFAGGRSNPLRQRLLYTAISRASKRVIFLK
jgi:hypothetical protein